MNSSDLTSHRALAVSPLGLESVAAEEMRALGLAVGSVERDRGLVHFEASTSDIVRANLHLRCVERVTIEAGTFRALHFAEFRRKAAAIEWEKWLAPGQPVLARVTSRASKLYHERGLAERLLAAISDRLGCEAPPARPASLDDPDFRTQLVVLRVHKDRCLVRIDSSGPRLHRRGYRLASAKAPLRETLAAAILRLSEWEVDGPLLDPFCGSGTFVIEAAMRSLSIAPGLHRRFALERWPGETAAAVEAQRDEAKLQGRECGSSEIRLVGGDRDRGAVGAAGENAERAGVHLATRFVARSLSESEPIGAGPGWIVCNPPFGHRVSRGNDLRDLGTRFGQVLRSRFSGWRVTILAGDPAFARASGLDWREGPLVNDGGLRAPVLTAPVR